MREGLDSDTGEEAPDLDSSEMWSVRPKTCKPKEATVKDENSKADEAEKIGDNTTVKEKGKKPETEN